MQNACENIHWKKGKLIEQLMGTATTACVSFAQYFIHIRSSNSDSDKSMSVGNSRVECKNEWGGSETSRRSCSFKVVEKRKKER